MRELPTPGALLAAAFLGALAVPALLGDLYAQRLLTLGLIYAVVVVGYDAVFGHAGALNLAQGAFFGLGAYATGILGGRYGWGAELTLPLAVAIPALAAAAIGVPVLRLESHYFALATLGIAQAALLFAVNAEALTGGANGIANVPGLAFFGLAVPRGTGFLAAALTALIAVGVPALWLTGGRRGFKYRLMREDALAAAASGIDPGVLRQRAFVFAAAAGGLGGALQAHFLGVVSPEVLEFPVMVSVLAMAVIGGRARVPGAIVGAVLLVHLPEWLRALGQWYLVAYGAALLGAIVFAPSGVVGAWERLFARRASARVTAARRSPAAAPEARLVLAGLSKSFGGVEALAGVDLSLAPGEMLGLIGPNGSGKTTLLNAIAGQTRADAGRILWRGREIGSLPAFRLARLGIARGFQLPRLMEGATALDNVAVAVPGAAGLARARAEALACLDRLGLAGAAERNCGELPGGVRRAVEIARALAARPALLLLDEPAAGLAPGEQADLAARLAALNREGLGMIVVEHALSFLLPLVPRVVCLDRGRVVADGPPAALVRDARVIAAYLGTARP